MKSLFNLRSLLFTLTVAVIAGCSGITETTLPDADHAAVSSASADVLYLEVPDFIESNETNVPTILPTEDRYKDRE